jgi:hypothetical protein
VILAFFIGNIAILKIFLSKRLNNDSQEQPATGRLVKKMSASGSTKHFPQNEISSHALARKKINLNYWFFVCFFLSGYLYGS